LHNLTRLELEKNTQNMKYSLVSLFAGAGGLDLGFEQAGFNTLDNNKQKND
jgi:C-5 cytosine-specific DNA methylase